MESTEAPIAFEDARSRPTRAPSRAERRWAGLGELAARSSVHVGSAMVVMGSWAAFANRAHGARAALTAGFVQAAASASVTFTLKRSLEAMAARMRGAAEYVLPPSVTCVVVFALLVAVHRLAGTREIWATIAVPYSASSLYAWVYSALLARRRRAAELLMLD